VRLWAFRAALLVSALVLVIGAGELAVRSVGLAPDVISLEVDSRYGSFVTSENPLLVYVPRPGSADVNAYGIRDHDYPLDKPPGVFRIVVLGDSFGYGLYVSIDDAFPKLIEKRLQTALPPGFDRLEVINLSVSGYDTEQEVEFFVQKGLRLSPDLVLVSFVLNDFFDSSWVLRRFETQEGFEQSRGILAQVERSVFYRSHLVRLVLVRVPLLKQRLAPEAPESESEEGDRVRRGFARLRALADEHDFDVVIAIWPDLEEPLDSRYGKHAIHRASADRARAVDFAVVDMFEPFARIMNGNARPFRVPDGHPDEKGHAAAAQVIGDFLESRLKRVP